MTSLTVSPLAPYRSPDERDAAFDDAVDRGGGTTEVYGTSHEGRPLRAARFPRIDSASTNAGGKQTDDVSAVLLSANIHGPEWISTALAIAFAQSMAVGDEVQLGRSTLGRPRDDGFGGELIRLRERADVYIAPCLNPDGYARTWELAGDAPVATLRTNAGGVDLNRNFPIPAGFSRSKLPGQGSTKKGAATYIGASALSEPETKHLASFLARTPLVASANVHSFMGTTIPPRVTSSSAYKTYQALSRAFSNHQSGVRYWRLQSRFFDGFTGELEDHQHHVHRTWAMTVECFPLGASFAQHLFAPTTFWRFNPRDVERWVQNDLPGVVGFFHAALDVGPVQDP